MTKFISVEGPLSVASVVFNPVVGEELAPEGAMVATDENGHRYVVAPEDLEDVIAQVTNSPAKTVEEVLTIVHDQSENDE
jgi:hypothetical protein